MRIVAFVGILACSGLFAQTAPPRLEFEVASIRPAAPSDAYRLSSRMSVDEQQIRFSNVSLHDIIMRAYDLRTYQVSGPDWINSTRFDISAKLPQGSNKEQVPQMLQTLLEDRFKLVFHHEKKELPAYALVVGKNGSKLQPAGAQGNFNVSITPKGRKIAAKLPLARFADVLSNLVDRPVVDMTGLEGPYDITLEWFSNDNAPLRSVPAGLTRPDAQAAPDADSGVSIYTAIQEQLGLKLEARRIPLDLLIVDNMGRVPTEN